MRSGDEITVINREGIPVRGIVRREMATEPSHNVFGYAYVVAGTHSEGTVFTKDEGVRWLKGWSAENRSSLRATFNLSDEDETSQWQSRTKTYRDAGGMGIPLGAPVFLCPSDPNAVQMLPAKDGDGRRIGKVTLVNADYTVEVLPD